MVFQRMINVRPNQDTAMKDASVSGTLEVTGVLTATGGVVGDSTGDSTGTHIGGVQLPIILVTADGAVAVPAESTIYRITKAGIAAMTLVDPTAVTHDGIVLTFIAATANAHTLDLVTGINGGAADIGTYGGAAGDGVSIIAINGEWFEMPGANTNVTFI